jgi:hypothetical protein
MASMIRCYTANHGRDTPGMNLVVLSGLLGTVVGVAGTLIGQHRATRAAEKRDRAASAAERRTECHQIIESIFHSGQEIERIIAEQSDRPSGPIHGLWVLYSRLRLVASEQLRGPLDDYADALNRAYRHGTPHDEPAWKYLHGPRERFTQAANSELKSFDARAAGEG